MLKKRQSRDRLIFNMGIPIPGKDTLYIETGPLKAGYIKNGNHIFWNPFMTPQYILGLKIQTHINHVYRTKQYG